MVGGGPKDCTLMLSKILTLYTNVKQTHVFYKAEVTTDVLCQLHAFFTNFQQLYLQTRNVSDLTLCS